MCVDTGHHAMGVNIEQIVAILLQEGRLGGFDLNDKKYGDDDLMVGSIDPYQLFRICHELVKARATTRTTRSRASAPADVVYMLDQCHNIEPKIPAVIRSVMNLQEAFAKALLVDLPRSGGPGERRRARSQPPPQGRVRDRRPAAAGAGARAPPACPRIPYRAYLASDERASAAPRRASAAWRMGGNDATPFRFAPPIDSLAAATRRLPSSKLLAYRSNLLGADRSVANWGGGNTSCKTTEVGLSRSADARAVGQGLRLRPGRRFEPKQFTGLRLDDLEPLVERESMRDEDLVRYYEHAVLKPGQPRASIETPLHSMLPFAHVDHTHPDAIIALCAVPDGPELARRLWGDRAIWVDVRAAGLRPRQEDRAGRPRATGGDVRADGQARPGHLGRKRPKRATVGRST